MEANNVLTVVMPVYNEEKTIVTIVEKVLERPEVGELIIVNDASKDNSWEKLQTFADNPRVRLLNQEVNRGKGAALIRGFAEATKPFVMVQDADFEYTPEDYPIVLGPLVSGKADVVYGSRFMGTPGQVRFFRQVPDLLVQFLLGHPSFRYGNLLQSLQKRGYPESDTDFRTFRH